MLKSSSKRHPQYITDKATTEQVKKLLRIHKENEKIEMTMKGDNIRYAGTNT